MTRTLILLAIALSWCGGDDDIISVVPLKAVCSTPRDCIAYGPTPEGCCADYQAHEWRCYDFQTNKTHCGSCDESCPDICCAGLCGDGVCQ